jgi:phenylacetate-CoA ligase
VSESRTRWLAALDEWRREPDGPADDRFWAPDLETVSREELRDIQGAKLRLAVPYMYEHCPLFRRNCEERGVEPGDVRGMDELTALPVTTKSDMSGSLDGAPPWGEYTAIDDDVWRSRGWQLFQTSGTTGAPRPFRYTQVDREQWAWTDARAMHAMGIRAGRDVGMMCFGYGPHVAMWGVHHAMILMGVANVSGGGLDTRARARAIDRYRPTFIAATPSYSLYLAATMQELGLDPAASSVERVMCGGEPLPPATQERIAGAWGARVDQFYGCTEAAPSCGGYTCASAMHFMEDTHVLETVDPETLEPVADGERGLSVVTNLCSEASPQVRFLVGDYTTLELDPCECGRAHVRARGGFAGRADDMLNVRGVTLFPSAIEQVIRAFPELGEEFQIVISSKGSMDELTVVAEPLDRVPEADHEGLAGRLEGAFRAELELRPGIELKPYGTLPKTEFKAKRVRDLREGQ